MNYGFGDLIVELKKKTENEDELCVFNKLLSLTANISETNIVRIKA